MIGFPVEVHIFGAVGASALTGRPTATTATAPGVIAVDVLSPFSHNPRISRIIHGVKASFLHLWGAQTAPGFRGKLVVS